MSDLIHLDSFAYYFKKYRLKANIATLKQFSDIMCEEGIFYDASIYTRWQNGERIPNDRKVILGMIRIFINRNAIETMDECNLLLASAKQDILKKGEINNIGKYSENIKSILPVAIEDFIGREDVLRELNWKLITYNTICITGTAGIGKSTFVIYLANLLQKSSNSTVFYFRTDIQYIDTILNNIARYYGEDITAVKNVNDRLIYVMKIVKNKKVTIILDNIDNYSNLESFIRTLEGYCKFILVSQFKPPLYRDAYNVPLSGFNEEETITLANQKLGPDYVIKNRLEILEIAKLSGYSPLALDIIFSYIYNQKITTKELLTKIDKVMLPIAYQSTYDNKTVASSIEISLSTLEKPEKNVVSSLSMFDGTDISVNALKAIHSISDEQMRQILIKLIELSLIERSYNNRIKIHPLVRTYLRQRAVSSKLYLRLTEYYLNLKDYDNELDNVRGVIRYLNDNNYSQYVVNIWNRIAVSLLEEGRYEDIKNYKVILERVAYQDTNPSLLLNIITSIYFIFGFLSIKDPNHGILFSMIYWPLATYGIFFGILIYKKWQDTTTLIGRSILFFILGLSAQVVGQILYSILTIIESNNVSYPYPSVGDIAYFGSIPLYILATILLGQALGIKINLQSLRSKIQSVFIPLIILTFSYVVFLKNYSFDFSNIPKIILDFGYPLGQSIYLSFIILIFLLSKENLLPILRKAILYILVALSLQFTADFMFLYRFSHMLWNISGDYGDLVYLLAYGTMGISLLQFDYTYKLKDPNHPDFFTRVKNYLVSK